MMDSTKMTIPTVHAHPFPRSAPKPSASQNRPTRNDSEPNRARIMATFDVVTSGASCEYPREFRYSFNGWAIVPTTTAAANSNPPAKSPLYQKEPREYLGL